MDNSSLPSHPACAALSKRWNDAADDANTVSLSINQHRVRVAAGTSVAAAIAIAGSLTTRLSVRGQPRAPLCGMGVCQECRVTIDGRQHQLACQTPCTSGMQVLTMDAGSAT